MESTDINGETGSGARGENPGTAPAEVDEISSLGSDPAAGAVLHTSGNQDDPEAMVALGLVALDEQRLDDAHHWFTQAAEMGSANAVYHLASMARQQGDVETALRLYQQAVELGAPFAAVELAWYYHFENDHDTAAEMLLQAEALGWEPDDGHPISLDAMRTIGMKALQEGNDPDRAELWWRKAASAGDTEAMYNLGTLARSSGDIDTAISWYEASAEGGDTDAMVQLAAIAQQRNDDATARRWLTRAAEGGDINARMFLEQPGQDD